MLLHQSLLTQRATEIYNLGFYNQNKVDLIEDDNEENKQILIVISDGKTVKQHSALKFMVLQAEAFKQDSQIITHQDPEKALEGIIMLTEWSNPGKQEKILQTQQSLVDSL